MRESYITQDEADNQGRVVDKYLKSREAGRPRVFEVSNISEFVEVATWLYSDDHVIFRGQTKEKGWPLVPAVGRHMDGSQVLWKEREIVEEFKRESIPYLDIVPDDDNYWQWLALAQHNRLPTRLLDWSKNPLVALWFAVKDPAKDKEPGVVWAFHYEESEAIFRTKNRDSPFEIARTFVYFPEHIFPSIQAQSCIFTIHHREGERPGRFPPLEQIMKDPDFLLTKIEIAQPFQTFCYQLFRVGVSPASLFPGLSGLVDRIRYDNIMREDEGNT
jgi:FRG domain